MDFMDDLKNSFSRIAKRAYSETEKVAGKARVEIEICATKEKISKTYEKIGEAVYKYHRACLGEMEDEKLAFLLLDMEKYEKKLASLNEKKNEQKQ